MQVNLQLDDDTSPVLSVSEHKGKFFFSLDISKFDEANRALGAGFIS